jgi:hypothetical protein
MTWQGEGIRMFNTAILAVIDHYGVTNARAAI